MTSRKTAPTPTEKLTVAVDTLTELLRRLEPAVRKNGDAETLRKATETVRDTLHDTDVEVAEKLVKYNKDIADALLERSSKTDAKLDAILSDYLPALRQSMALLGLKMNLIIGGATLIFPVTGMIVGLHAIGVF